jgi:hypothetical protein
MKKQNGKKQSMDNVLVFRFSNTFHKNVFTENTADRKFYTTVFINFIKK